MEIVDRITIDLEKLADLLPATKLKPKTVPDRDRSVWHVTNLLQSAQSIIKGDIQYHEYEGRPSGIMSLGRIWEFIADIWLENYARSQGGVYVANVAAEKDGIVASLDGMLCLPDISDQFIVSESKLRFTTADAIPDAHLRQICCYCHISDTCFFAYPVLRIGSKPPTAEAELIIGHIPHPQPAEVWQSVLKTKLYLESKGVVPNGGRQ